MAVFMRYLGQLVCIDMSTGTPGKEHISIAAKRYKEAAQGRFESCVPTLLIQLPRYSLNQFKRNRTTCLAVTTATLPSVTSKDEEEEDQKDAIDYYRDDNNLDGNDVAGKPSTPSTSSARAPGQILYRINLCSTS